jgi:hypothetical protein
MNLDERKNIINNQLTDSQVISISKFITDQMREKYKIQKNDSSQITDSTEVLHSLYKEIGYNIDKEKIDEYVKKADEKAISQSGREFLTLVAEKVEDKEILDVLDEELEDPPNEPVAFIDPLSITLVVMGSVALMNVINGIKYENKEFSFVPARGNQNMKTILNGVAKIFKSIIPGQ